MIGTLECPEVVGSESCLGALPKTQQRSTGDFFPSAKSSYVQQSKSFDPVDDGKQRSEPLKKAQNHRIQSKDRG